MRKNPILSSRQKTKSLDAKVSLVYGIEITWQNMHSAGLKAKFLWTNYTAATPQTGVLSSIRVIFSEVVP